MGVIKERGRKIEWKRREAKGGTDIYKTMDVIKARGQKLNEEVEKLKDEVIFLKRLG